MTFNRPDGSRRLSGIRGALVAMAMAVTVALAGGCGPRPEAQGSGPIVAVGGGTIDDEIYVRMLALGGGSQAIVAVLPQASAVEDAGASAVDRWKAMGAADARKYDFADVAATRAGLERATLIWIPGGSQSRFMDAIRGTGLVDLIRARHRAGVLVGGTSAGAAVLSRVMITGDADLQNIMAGKTVAGEGLGLWPEVIVDQHFLQRQRANRLVSAVLDQPSLVGVGIDEGTAVVVRGTHVEVIGRSAVVVVDGRRATVETTLPGGVHAGQNLALHVLRAGMSIELD
jgi:cyanophycinase